MDLVETRVNKDGYFVVLTYQVSSKLYKSVPTVRRWIICTVKCICNSLIHNLQGKRALIFCV